MTLIPRTLHGKLVAAMVALIAVTGLSFVALALTTTRLYLEEVNQRLHRTLAENLVAENDLVRDETINHAALEHAFHNLMIVNPGIEVYLLDADGRIIAFSAPPGKVQRERINLQPVAAFLSGGSNFPIRGEDPRDPAGHKVFSAAPVMDRGVLAGYLYVVLGGEAYDSVARIFQGSYILRLAAGVAAAGLIVALGAGVLAFVWLTRRPRRLSAEVEAFRQSDFQEPLKLRGWRPDPKGDEIDRLALTVERMSERIVQQIAQLRGADTARRDMVANISHDLRTPLTSLQGYLETILMKGEALSADDRRHYVELALKHSQRLGQLTEELFELAKLESEQAPVQFETFSLAELVQDVAQKFRLEADQRQIILETESPRDAALVSADIALIERVLENLIENALRYTPKGGRVRLSLHPGAGRIEASISDTGRGIPASELPHIFERFYRVEKARGDALEGSGLGLAIVHRILELHGSLIEVESELGVGTRFRFALQSAA
jgi:two-component system OmpR family sensor kinase